MEEEESAERRRRESNYAQLSNFRGALKGAITGSMDDSVLAIRDIHNNHVISFENTDDHYKNRLDFYYKKWSSVGDKFADLGNLTKDIACGAVDAVIDFVVGVLGLLAGVVELTVWMMLPRDFLQHFGLMPEWLEEDIGEMESTVEMLLTDPGNALEAMVQSLSDTADEKGMAYSVSYAVVDMVALDKLLGKLGKLGKVEDVAGTATTMEKITDAADVGRSLENAGDVTETVVKSSIEAVEDHVDEMAEVAIKESAEVVEEHADDMVGTLEGGLDANLLDDMGEFADDALENNYQAYVNRKISKGQTPKDRLEWKKASDYWTKESPVARGNNFNKTVREADIYDYHEVYLENGKRLDSCCAPLSLT